MHRLRVECLGLRTAVPCGRTECVPPRKPPCASSPGSPRKAISPPLAPPRRGGLRTPAGEVMPRHEHGLATRTHRVRPSEKTALRVMPVFSPLGHPSLDSPPRRGGLRTLAGEVLPPPGDRAIRPPGVRLAPMIMLCLGMGTASQRGRTECVPPRKPPFAPSPGLPCEAIRAGLAPAQGRFVPEDQGQASSASQLGGPNGVFPNSRAWAPSGHLESLHEFATTVRLLRNIAPTATKGVRSPPNAAASATEL